MKTKSQSNIGIFKDIDFPVNEPKHAAMTRLLENQIRRMRHGERLPVMRELMQKYAISQCTLDHALFELEAANLISRRRGSGIYVNRKSISRKTSKHAIGVVVFDITNPFCSLLVKGIEQKLAAWNYLPVLCNGHEKFKTELETINALHGRIDGALINPNTANVHNPDYVHFFSEMAQSREIPFLLLDTMIPGVNAPFIGFDNFSAFRDMARLLAGSKMRFKQILYFGAMESIVGAERIQGFQAGLRETGFMEDALKIINIHHRAAEITITPDMVAGKLPALIISASPLYFTQLLAFCNANNLRIPEDVALAGVLEENFRDYIHAPVIGWIKPAVQLGELSARLIQSIIAGKPVAQITKLALEKFVPESLRYLF